MATLKTLDDLLTTASKILDQAATQIRDIPLEPTKEYIRKVGHALTLIFEIQHEIYRLEPSLEPEYLRKEPPYPGEGRKFGDIIIEAADYEQAGDFEKAIALYEAYISEAPPDFFANMARNQIQRIKKESGV